MNKKISLGLTLSLIAVSIAVTFILTSFFSLQSFNTKVVDVNEKAKKYAALQSLDAIVRENYLGDINEQSLEDSIMKGYVEGLNDKYSRYMTAEEYLTQLNNESGTLVGLGLTLSEDESGYIRISEILSNSPAAEAGILLDDLITTINGIDVKTISFSEAADAMKGVEGSTISLTVRRGGRDTEYTIIRRSIVVNSVEAEMLGGLIGYIKISSFKKNTPDQFIEALEHLTANGAEALIIDLRDNGGGLVTALQGCLDPLLPEGIIAVAEYKDGHSETLVYSDNSEINLPIAILVNKKTASSAEIFSASLRDFGKAVLVGEQTYGKGVMQSTTELDDGGALTLTVAECRTIYSPSCNGIGLTPDYPVENGDDDIDMQYNKAIEVVNLMKAQ